MKRLPRSGLILVPVSLVSVIALAASPASGDEKSADDCVRVRETAEDNGVNLDLDNNCDRRLTCAMSWTVHCEDSTGRVTRTKKDMAHFQMGTSSTSHAFADAKSCASAAGWRVEDVTWACSPLK
jgi:hypothetical protein